MNRRDVIRLATKRVNSIALNDCLDVWELTAREAGHTPREIAEGKVFISAHWLETNGCGETVEDYYAVIRSMVAARRESLEADAERVREGFLELGFSAEDADEAARIVLLRGRAA